ncbi:hypothetical protein [Tianweitania sediminis]|uniref:Uncharacterized protein n=1 Tax=Tianweitania sediminis TaxID=1502156 RepID=A0A8J7RLP5_9HYPH|nr:hypothetical protein [Tianweitania sediminis]MBP0439476.1 hypothetical protein [Tianweitania sediminis]
MRALTLSDLREVAAEPRIKDVKLAEVLGLGRARRVREMIIRNRPEMEGFGPLKTYRGATTVSGGRPDYQGFWLNEAQALLVCMFSRTEKAAAVRAQVIRVFLAWRHGSSPAASDPLQAFERRISVLEQATEFQPISEGATFARAVAHLPMFPGQRHKRYPKFWGDIEVREYLIKLHRQHELAVVHSSALARFGEKRTPSISAIHRFWMRLDSHRGHAPFSTTYAPQVEAKR